MKTKCVFTLILSVWTVCSAFGQSVLRVEPPNWWTGMSEKNLQLLVYGEAVRSAHVQINYPGVELAEVVKPDSENYLFLDLVVQPDAKPGEFRINFTFPSSDKKLVHTYELKAREKGRSAHLGLDHTDVIYLITPDRFVNGDPSNDEVKGLKEGKNRTYYNGRHGGDLAGIISKIDYISDLGATAVWLNPVLENDMPRDSYHGYATTDYYKVDPRYGSNEQYRKLATQLHNRGMKLIMDMVFNHCGLDHWWMSDPPFNDWINYYPEYVNTNHAMASLSDPYAASDDMEKMEKGWFVSSMPDLNHANPFMANYLVQNSVWWIEYAGLDGIRMDTYPYNNKEFMVEWAKQIYKAYPDFYIVGETWVDNEAHEAYWAGKNESTAGFNSHLNSITDFPLCQAVRSAFAEDGDVIELYNVLSKDFLYDYPYRNKIFADNHDMDRFYHAIGEDLDKFRNAMTFLLTTRGIPQIYYGTEILMKGSGHHGVLREDFPGGWRDDERDAFTLQGRTDAENRAFDHLQTLLNWRKKSEAIKNGSLIHFVPYDNIYVYNRKAENESVVVIINNNTETRELDMSRYKEALAGYNSGVDVLSNKKFDELDALSIGGNEALILLLDPQPKTEIKQ